MIISTKDQLKYKDGDSIGEYYYWTSGGESEDGMRYTTSSLMQGLCYLQIQHLSEDNGNFIYDLKVVSDSQLYKFPDDEALYYIVNCGLKHGIVNGKKFPEEFVAFGKRFLVKGSLEAISERYKSLRETGQWSDALDAGLISLDEIALYIKENNCDFGLGSFGKNQSGNWIAKDLLKLHPELASNVNAYSGNFRERLAWLRGIELNQLKPEKILALLKESYQHKLAFSQSELETIDMLPDELKGDLVKFVGTFTSNVHDVLPWMDRFYDKFLEGLYEAWSDLEHDRSLGRTLVDALNVQQLQASIIFCPQFLTFCKDFFARRYTSAYQLESKIISFLPKMAEKIPKEKLKEAFSEADKHQFRCMQNTGDFDKKVNFIKNIFLLEEILGLKISSMMEDTIVKELTTECDLKTIAKAHFPVNLQRRIVEGVILRYTPMELQKKYHTLQELFPDLSKEITAWIEEREAQPYECEFHPRYCACQPVIVRKPITRNGLKTILRKDTRIFHPVTCNESGLKNGEIIPINNLSRWLFGVPGHRGALSIKDFDEEFVMIKVHGGISKDGKEVLDDIFSKL